MRTLEIPCPRPSPCGVSPEDFFGGEQLGGKKLLQRGWGQVKKNLTGESMGPS